ncbi:MAG: DUF2288 domain-containing protein [Deltaproteobacteria bacterium]|nr:MAG: DUF2288 domain-containing protein [Deltaproteobacteria bacterium]
MDATRTKLQEELAVVDWRALRPQLGRDHVILAAPELDLVEVAWCVARDRAAEVGAWIDSGQLRKPDATELAAWERELAKPFRMLIVAPYVLIQAA